MDKDHNNQPVKFYQINLEHGYLNNIYPSPFTQNGIKYWTNQHYFQSKKFQGLPYELQIAKSKQPLQAFDMGQTRTVPLRSDWNEMKQTIMYNGLKLKYNQNPDLKQKLLATGQREIIQHTDNDHYWGDGLGKGKNRLGILLMQLRKQFRQNKQ